ncbi:MAG: hypothetical protein ACOCWZ_10435 [Spirochaetota bacterium]
MITVSLTDEQVFSLVEQLPKDKKMELLNHLQFDQWLESPEALELKNKSEESAKAGKTLNIEKAREKLLNNGKDA